MMVEPGKLYRSGGETASYRQRFLHSEANLKFLDCGEFHIPAGLGTGTEMLPDRESLLFMWKGRATVELAPERYALDSYDTLYVPRGRSVRIENPFPETACVIRISAPAENVHPPFHSSFAEISRREDRIRHLKGKDVYMMFDVGEAADKLVAGYTFFQPYQRSWPPHNHTDQEEVYFFIKGHGSMEVYEAPETLSFVHNVAEGDLVTIPMLNYHPVFSQERPARVHLVHRGRALLGGRQEQEFHERHGDQLDYVEVTT